MPSADEGIGATGGTRCDIGLILLYLLGSRRIIGVQSIALTDSPPSLQITKGLLGWAASSVVNGFMERSQIHPLLL